MPQLMLHHSGQMSTATVAGEEKSPPLGKLKPCEEKPPPER